MRRRDREIIEIGECASLASVIDRLQQFQGSLGEDSQAEVKFDGDDVFGWRFTITYFRDPTPEEVALEARYALPSIRKRSRRLG